MATPGRDEAERQFVESLLRGQYGSPENVLKVLRDYPQVCVLQLRIINDQEKEAKGYAAN